MSNKSLIEDPEDIQLNEFYDLQQILGDPPQWLLKWGIGALFIFFGLMTVLGTWIKYPDKVYAEGVLTTDKPPVRIKSPQQEQIVSILVKNQDQVQEGQLLAVFKNTGYYPDIETLDKLLQEVIGSGDYQLIQQQDNSMQLGPIEQSFQKLKRDVSTLNFRQDRSDAIQKIRLLNSQMKHLEALNVSIDSQSVTLEQELALRASNLKRYQGLAEEKIQSEETLEEVESLYLQTKRSLDQLKSDQLRNQVTIDQLKLQVVDIRESDLQLTSDQTNSIDQQIITLRREIEAWQAQNLVTAPVSGEVVFTLLDYSKQFVETGQELMVINPVATENTIQVKAGLSPANFGKVALGQSVIIQLDGFPYQEFGALAGRLAAINAVPEEQNGVLYYQAYIELTNGLITNTYQSIPFKQEMTASLEIITENQSFFGRILKRLRYFWEEHQG